MKRLSDSKALISLISVTFIVLVGMAMTGCATPLMEAAYKGDINTIKVLLDKGADVNEQATCSMNDPINSTALICAASHGHTDIVKFLLDRGANVDQGAIYGITALMCAAREGQTGVVKLLLDRGADIDKKIELGTPLSWAAERGHYDTVKVLVERGADIDYAIIALRKTGQSNAVAMLMQIDERRKTTTQAAMPPSLVKEISPPLPKSDIDELPAIKAKPNKSSYAIVIGIESYRQKLPKADFATQDAKLVADYLTKALGYPEENVITLLNDHASNVDLVKYFEKWLPNNVEKDSTVFVYYSGHGAPDPKSGSAYLVPYDGDPSFIDETGYSLKRMYSALSKLPAKEVIVALDSCFSGAGGRSVLAKGARPLVMNLNSSAVLPINMTVLSASSGDQISSTYDEKGHGLFTYFMLKGIKNEDVTRPDGSLKLDDLYGYVKPQVERIARKQYNNEQSPQLIEGKKN